MNAKTMSTGFSKIANRGQETFYSHCGANIRSRMLKLVAFSIGLLLATNSFGQEKREIVTSDTSSDLLWKKLESPLKKSPGRLDGVMGVAHSRSY
jgi:hypothetical protein